MHHAGAVFPFGTAVLGHLTVSVDLRLGLVLRRDMISMCSRWPYIMLKHKRYSNLFFTRCVESVVPFQGHAIGVTGHDMLINVIQGTSHDNPTSDVGNYTKKRAYCATD